MMSTSKKCGVRAVSALLAGVVGCGSSAHPGDPTPEGVVSGACTAWKPSEAAWSSLPVAIPPILGSPVASDDGKYVYELGTWLDRGVPQSRIFRSQDLGTSWCELPTDESISNVAPTGPAVLYATTSSRKLLRTGDGGGTWVTNRFPSGI